MTTRIVAALALSSMMAAGTAAHATPIFAGSFVGLSEDTIIAPGAPGGFITQMNVPATGTFSLDVGHCMPYTSSTVFVPSCFAGYPELTISFSVPSIQPFRSPYPGGLVSVYNTPTSQKLVLQGGYAISSPSEGILTLVGGPNAFLDGTDFQSLHAGVVDLSNSSFQNVGSRVLSTYIQFTSVTFTDVPEPSDAALLGAVACVGLAVRRGKRRPKG